MANWSRYASVYDLMAENNAAYQEIIDAVLRSVRNSEPNDGARIADLGAGTGNFSTRVAAEFPTTNVIHLDADPAMVQIAEEKARRLNLLNWRPVTKAIGHDTFEPNCLDICIAVHSLYAMPSPLAVLTLIRRWLRPSGVFVVCDLGRILNIRDWAEYFWRCWQRDQGTLHALALFWRGREVARQNRTIRRLQRQGDYWTHSGEDFQQTLIDAGFTIEQYRPMYRNYSDFAVCRKRR